MFYYPNTLGVESIFVLTILAGLPAAILKGGTSLVTTELAATIEPSKDKNADDTERIQNVINEDFTHNIKFKICAFKPGAQVSVHCCSR